jgi:hypothetical protein
MTTTAAYWTGLTVTHGRERRTIDLTLSGEDRLLVKLIEIHGPAGRPDTAPQILLR